MCRLIIFFLFFLQQDHFHIGCSIVILLQHKDLFPGQHQRLAAIYLLYDMYRNEPIAANPFAPVFIHLLQPSSHEEDDSSANGLPGFGKIPGITPQEKLFISQVIEAHVPVEYISLISPPPPTYI